ncbi:dTDP-4-dehydrorhamnose 3,5-epimerase [Enterobacteriaceae bacterium BIT-l23]|uniref:dTDP-4-dehydrorhamnose 3,5-epimerase n=1 Tax=Jejubacter sp. L23 TaxID=3092086 RepID=UPI0015850013|nr:dTDP-4-dehydrorhamnose 3,5-epimerase [Enterobacteriaceae bacterium BIT-l23]
MEIIKTFIDDLIVIKPKIFGDHRGFFYEMYNKKAYEYIGIADEFVQDNRSASQQGVLRGLHFQTENAQGKLVSVLQGEVYDVAVDLRKGSKTFGKHYGLILSGENKIQMYIPPGFAHGFVVISSYAEFCYKCTQYYSPEHESGIIWDDKDLSIDWPVKEPILSEKDKKLDTFENYKKKMGMA